MAAEGEVVNGCTFTAQIEDTDLWVGHTTIVPRFRVRLVLAVTVAPSGSSSHFYKIFGVYGRGI
jgi:hypothetical protein